MKKIPVRHIKEPGFTQSFSIREIKAMLSGKEMIQELHRHNYFFVLVLEKGFGEHIIDFKNYPVNDYSVFFMRPGQVHQLTLKKDCSGYLMGFNTEFYSPREKVAKQVFRNVSNKNYYQFNLDNFKKILTILAYIFQEFSNKPDKYQEVIRANLEILFIELMRQNQLPDHLSNDKDQLYTQDRLEAFLELVDTNLFSKKQVNEYAEMLHLSPYQLNAITKELLGKTGSQVIIEHIILEAKRQLLATSNQVNQVALLLGYEDASYFIRFFKKHTGYSPATFRQNFK